MEDQCRGIRDALRNRFGLVQSKIALNKTTESQDISCLFLGATIANNRSPLSLCSKESQEFLEGQHFTRSFVSAVRKCVCDFFLVSRKRKQPLTYYAIWSFVLQEMSLVYL